jgi:hypothetical protein
VIFCSHCVAVGGAQCRKKEDLLLRASYLRPRAKEVLAEAEIMANASARRRMRAIAARYEKLAQRLEKESGGETRRKAGPPAAKPASTFRANVLRARHPSAARGPVSRCAPLCKTEGRVSLRVTAPSCGRGGAPRSSGGLRLAKAATVKFPLR